MVPQLSAKLHEPQIHPSKEHFPVLESQRGEHSATCKTERDFVTLWSLYCFYPQIMILERVVHVKWQPVLVHYVWILYFRRCTMDAMTLAIASTLIWIGNNTDYNIYIPWPTVVYMDEVSIQKYVDPSVTEVNRDEDIIGIYSQGERRIALVEETDIQTPEGMSTLFHEVFHHVQNLNRDKAPQLMNDCEKEDYRFENKWRKEHHLKPIDVPDLSTGKEKCY